MRRFEPLATTTRYFTSTPIPHNASAHVTWLCLRRATPAALHTGLPRVTDEQRFANKAAICARLISQNVPLLHSHQVRGSRTPNRCGNTFILKSPHPPRTDLPLDERDPLPPPGSITRGVPPQICRLCSRLLHGVPGWGGNTRKVKRREKWRLRCW